jgi:hypothetical protein
MLEFCKEVLTKVSFDRFLFAKELNKAIKWLNGEELKVFRNWCVDRFGNLYSDIIASTFKVAI